MRHWHSFSRVRLLRANLVVISPALDEISRPLAGGEFPPGSGREWMGRPDGGAWKESSEIAGLRRTVDQAACSAVSIFSSIVKSHPPGHADSAKTGNTLSKYPPPEAVALG